ncbi:hypothetical protein [Cellulomonas sp.]|uniref:hypothetical protein n=1 Tax=Cellulomonas sp. TaxID=40001 RepID=UPI001B16A5ED|nr:hypothetical protein [Cellulomonas sp.]MBO9554439.1 hypothetical protein [Cellulomonas sp.]
MTGRARHPLAAVVLAVTLVTAGCGSRPDLTDDRAATLQAAVLQVTSAAAAGRWDEADAALADTRARLDAGVDAGEVSTERYREIDRALDGVTAAVAAAKAQAAAAQAAAEQAAAAQAAAAQAAAAQAAADQAAAAQEGPRGPAPKPKEKGPAKQEPKAKGKG